MNPSKPQIRKLVIVFLIALALPSGSLFSQWASSAWASYGTLYVDTNRIHIKDQNSTKVGIQWR